MWSGAGDDVEYRIYLFFPLSRNILDIRNFICIIETMKLREYLEQEKVNAVTWAKRVNLPISGVYAWLSGKTIPTIENILKIKEATAGAVGPEDWT